MNDEHDGPDELPAPLHFAGVSGVEFMENLAHALADSLTFEGHGHLTEDERKAFLWGFRHGVHHTRGVLMEAAQSPQALDTITRMLSEATEAWNIGVVVRVLTVPGAGHDTAEETRH